MYTATLNATQEKDGLWGFIAAALAVLLVAALLAVAPAPASADGSTPPGTTKVMTLSNEEGGTALALGDVVTIAFDDGVTPVGNYFDIWFCPDKTIAPVANPDPGWDEVGECTPVTFWSRNAANVAADGTSRAVKANALTMSWVFGTEDSPAYFDYPTDTYGTNVDGINGEDFCDYVGWFLVVHDFSGGAHSNFLGPLSSRGSDCGPEPVEPVAVTSVPPVLTCSPVPAVPGGTLTCQVTGGDPDIDILWRAAFEGSVFASLGVRLGPDGVGSFSFVVPRGAACGTITVELVEWLPPMTIDVACSPLPTSLPAGEGGLPGPLALLGVLTLVGAAVLVRRMGVAAS
jgi:hypothetical protein